MDQREMFGELNALVHALAARLAAHPEQIAAAFENGSAEIAFAEDEDGSRALLVTYLGRETAITPADIAEAVRAIRDASGTNPDLPREG